MKLHLINNKILKSIDIDDNLKKEIKNPHSKFIEKYIKDYSLIINDNKNILTCIKKDIKQDELDNLLETITYITSDNNIISYECFNYLDNNDYDSTMLNNIYNYKELIENYGKEKLNDESLYIKYLFEDYRNLDLDKCFLNRPLKNFPNNKNSGAIIINKDSTNLISNTKRTHAEAIEESSKEKIEDLGKKSIIGLVSGNILYITLPEEINDYQKEKLRSLEKHTKNLLYNNGILVHLDIFQNTKRINSIHDIQKKKEKC